MTNVMVVAAHPDDEVLGCGATVARHVKHGDTVNILVLAEGATSRARSHDPDGPSEETKALRRAGGRSAKILGAAPPRFAELPDNRLDTVPLLDVVKIIEAVVEELSPELIYTHHGGDLNVDHRVVHQAVLTACRPLPNTCVQRIYSFETVSSTEWAAATPQQAFHPTRFVDVSAHIDKKLKALEAYGMEMRPFPHARSMESVTALARFRGASVGVEAAEAFMTVREVIK